MGKSAYDYLSIGNMVSFLEEGDYAQFEAAATLGVWTRDTFVLAMTAE